MERSAAGFVPRLHYKSASYAAFAGSISRRRLIFTDYHYIRVEGPSGHEAPEMFLMKSIICRQAPVEVSLSD